MKPKDILIRLLLMFAAVLAFTFFDWIVHSSWDYLAVPSFYFTNKIIYGTLWAWLASLAFRKGSISRQALLISAVTVGLLQIRYALYGYPLLFHAIVLTEHFAFMYAASYGALSILARMARR